MTKTPTLGNIMAIDDHPANLKLLEDMLQLDGYRVRSFPRGRLALTAAEREPPDLILLDINMPEMDGYEVCQRLKSDQRLASIPVIFLSALNAIEDKVKGFRSGGVDFISKPFQFEEVQARVETHLKLRRAYLAEQELLEQTLGGAVETLWELVQLTAPRLALRSKALRDIVRWLAPRLDLKDQWQLELAATLCLLGGVAVPEDVFEKAYYDQDVSPEEHRMFREHPAGGAHLLSNIPRLETVVEMIRHQQTAPAVDASATPAEQGARLLRVALELDRHIFRGIPCHVALRELSETAQFNSSPFDLRSLNALQHYSPADLEFQAKRLAMRDLRAGMILDEDLMSRDGEVLILKKETVLTDTWIQRLENYSRTRGTQPLVDVRIPGVSGAHKFAEPIYAVHPNANP